MPGCRPNEAVLDEIPSSPKRVLSALTGPIRIKPGDEGRLIVVVPYDAKRVEKIKTFVGRRWYQEEKHWTVPHTDGALAHLLTLFAGEAIEIDPSLQSSTAPTHRQAPPEPESLPDPKLLDRVRQAIRTRHYSYRTEKAYMGWINWLSDGYWAGIWFIQPEELLVIYCRNSGSIRISWALVRANVLSYNSESTLWRKTMLKLSYVKLPVVNLTQGQIDRRMVKLKERSGKSLNFDEAGEPVVQLKPKTKPPGDRRSAVHRRRKRCKVLGPEEWNLIFPDIPSEYGGMVCF